MTHLPRASARAAALLAAAMLCVVVTPGAALADDAAEPPTTTESAPEPESAPEAESAPEPAAAPAEEPVEAPVTALAAPEPGDPCFPGACIDNGTVRLGVNDDGSLILGTEDEGGSGTGLQQVDTGNDGLRAGSPQEGWGVADLTSGIGGSAVGGDKEDVTVESFDATPTTATSVVTVGNPDAPTFRVTHAFAPSLLDPNVYVIRVRIENLSDGTLESVRYRRVIDWDVEPTQFDELVSIIDRDLAIVETRTDGFNSADPRDANEDGETGDADDVGPNDLGATFDFDLGSIASGGFVEFYLFYGVAPTEAEALDSLATVGADSYSTARPSNTLDGSPGTFFFGYNPFPEGLETAPVDPTDPTDPVDPSDSSDPDGDAGSDDVEPVSATVPVSAAAQLPATGAESMAPFVVAGVALLAGGVAMVGLGRRRVEQA